MSGHAFPLIEVSGNAYELGYQHGTQAADLIQRYLLWIERLTRQPRDLLAHNALAFLPLIQSLSPVMIEEIRGLAAGAGITFAEAVLCQVRAEAAHIGEGGCTTFALTRTATADGHPLAGQNQDVDPEYADVGIVLRVQPNDGRPSALMFTFAGQLGYAGMNQYGVAQFANSVYDSHWQMGLTHYPLKRVMLEQRTVADCIAMLAQHSPCSPANVVLCDGQGDIADVEIRPAEGLARYSGEGSDAVLHTNHYVTPQFAPYETYSVPDSVPRLERIRTLVRDNWGQITVETMKQILADHAGDPSGICRHGGTGNWHSVCGYIAEPARGLLHIRRGHGCLGTWQTYQV